MSSLTKTEAERDELIKRSDSKELIQPVVTKSDSNNSEDYADTNFAYDPETLSDLASDNLELLSSDDGVAVQKTITEIEAMVKKTNEMNLVSYQKTKEIEEQFKDIQKRLDKNVEMLNTIREEMKQFTFEDEKTRLSRLHDVNPGDCLEDPITQEELEAEVEEVKTKLAALSGGSKLLSTISKETFSFSQRVDSALAKFENPSDNN